MGWLLLGDTYYGDRPPNDPKKTPEENRRMKLNYAQAQIEKAFPSEFSRKKDTYEE